MNTKNDYLNLKGSVLSHDKNDSLASRIVSYNQSTISNPNKILRARPHKEQMEFIRQQQFNEKISQIAFYGSRSKFIKSLQEKVPRYLSFEDPNADIPLCIKHSPLKEQDFILDQTYRRSEKRKIPIVKEHISSKFNLEKWTKSKNKSRSSSVHSSVQVEQIASDTLPEIFKANLSKNVKIGSTYPDLILQNIKLRNEIVLEQYEGVLKTHIDEVQYNIKELEKKPQYIKNIDIMRKELNSQMSKSKNISNLGNKLFFDKVNAVEEVKMIREKISASNKLSNLDKDIKQQSLKKDNPKRPTGVKSNVFFNI